MQKWEVCYCLFKQVILNRLFKEYPVNFMDAIEDWDCQAPKWQKHAIKMACVTQIFWSHTLKWGIEKNLLTR